jgi:type I restriction-modification system DNA methylase subunit
MNEQQAIRLVKETFESPFDRAKYLRFLRELLNGFDDEGARVNQGARIPDKFQEYVERLERVGKYTVEQSEVLLFIVHLKRETSLERARTMQRNFVAWYLQRDLKDAALVAFVSPNAADWRFSLVKMEYRYDEGKNKIREEFTPAKRWSFLVGPNEASHTAQSQFVKIIADDQHNPTLEQLAAAFNVEPVTKEFFKTFKQIFEEIETKIERDWNEEQKRLYTQRFFNRLLFIAFLERKGWLSFGGRVGLSDSEVRTETTGRDAAAGLDTVGRTPTYSTSGVRKDYLRALFEDYYQNTRDRNANFHRSRLNTLFFMGLNHPSGDKRSDAAYKPILSLIGDVPYLNGGLFEEEDDDKDGPTFPDALIAKVLHELVYQFNFTVTESTPLDVEVAVDPEMLGRIFEELVTGRHESGSYYTPKPVVQFMCREALKGYLASALPAETPDDLAAFVDKNDASRLKNPEAALTALRAVKVCDPACGSGAYLLGMLHELLEQRECLFTARQLDAATVYERKLEIIQNNLYGVDKDNFAVNIARLRLWLSLIVDFEGATPPPLPNLDFKIECGDSLTAPDPSGGLDLGFRSQLVNDFLLAKNKYTTAHHNEKKELKELINKLRDDIKTWSGRKASFNGFDWTIEFAEIFVRSAAVTTMSGAMAGLVNTSSGQMELAVTPPARTGFDIVLANPPYVRADAQFKHIEDEEERQRQIAEWQTFRKQLKDSKIYKTLHEKWDLYIPFLERAYQLLRQNGQMIFIIPDAYNAAKYAEKSHDFFLQNTVIERIDFCSEINLFDAGVNNTILHFAKISPTETSQPIRVRRWGENKDEFEVTTYPASRVTG